MIMWIRGSVKGRLYTSSTVLERPFYGRLVFSVLEHVLKMHMHMFPGSARISELYAELVNMLKFCIKKELFACASFFRLIPRVMQILSGLEVFRVEEPFQMLGRIFLDQFVPCSILWQFEVNDSLIHLA